VEEEVRTIVKLAGIAGVLLFTACGGKDPAVSDDFRKDLELASASSPITLATSQPAAQIVSAIERTAPPAPRRVAQSQRAPKHRPAPRALPAPVEVEEADLSEEVEAEPVEPSPAPVEVAPLPSPRPQPVASSGGSVGDGGLGRGDRGPGIGTIIGVVLRGGSGGIDECDPRTDGRRGGMISINNRIPVIGTFPGTGRIQGTFPGSGRLQATLPNGGRVRF